MDDEFDGNWLENLLQAIRQVIACDVGDEQALHSAVAMLPPRLGEAILLRVATYRSGKRPSDFGFALDAVEKDVRFALEDWEERYGKPLVGGQSQPTTRMRDDKAYMRRQDALEKYDVPATTESRWRKDGDFDSFRDEDVNEFYLEVDGFAACAERYHARRGR